MKLKGSEAIVKVLLEQGVDTVFGYPGGAVIPLYDALYDAPLKNVLTAHEQGAIHAADGYARASGMYRNIRSRCHKHCYRPGNCLS